MAPPTLWTPERDAELRRVIDSGRGFKEAAALIGMSISSLRSRYARIAGPAPRTHRGTEWTADKIETVRKLVGENLSDRAVGEHFGVSRYAIEALRIRIGLERGSKHRSIPHDFREICPTMTRNKLAVHYGVHPETIGRWCRSTGAIARAPHTRAPSQPRPANYSPKISAPIANTMRHPFTALREGGTVGEAVFQLQRAGLSVYRLRVVKHTAPIDMWVVGARRMQEADMIALAANRYGLRVAA